MKTAFSSFVLLIAYAAGAQWTKGMDDDAGKAAATSSADLTYTHHYGF